MLSDRDIKQAMEAGEITIDPFCPNQLGPASYDFQLGRIIIYYGYPEDHTIKPWEDQSQFVQKVEIVEGGYYLLQPQQLVLAATYEYIGVGPAHSAEITGKSSLARLGLVVHLTAGFVDPGNERLKVTLEIINNAQRPIALTPKMKIGQVLFYRLSSPAERPYGHPDLNSKYLNSGGVEASKMHLNYQQSD